MVFEAFGAHITGCRVTQHGLRGSRIAARAKAGTVRNTGWATSGGSFAEQRPTKNALITIKMSAPPAPRSDEIGTATGLWMGRSDSMADGLAANAPGGGCDGYGPTAG